MLRNQDMKNNEPNASKEDYTYTLHEPIYSSQDIFSSLMGNYSHFPRGGIRGGFILTYQKTFHWKVFTTRFSYTPSYNEDLIFFFI